MNCESVYNCVIITRKTDNIVQLEERHDKKVY